MAHVRYLSIQSAVMEGPTAMELMGQRDTLEAEIKAQLAILEQV